MRGRGTRVFLDNCGELIEKVYQDGIIMKQKNQYESLLTNLSMCIEQFSNKRIKLHLFGSRIIGLADEQSDLDIFVEHGKINCLINIFKIIF